MKIYARLKNAVYSVILIIFGVLAPVVCLDLFFLLFPTKIPLLVQVMAIRGPFGEAVRKYGAIFDRDSPYYGARLKQCDVRITRHPEFPDHELRTFQVLPDLWLRDSNPNGPFDALMMGDSFVFGYGVPESDAFVSRVESASGINILDVGVPGWSSGEVRVSLENYLEKLHPKTVCYFIYANDISDEVAKFDGRRRVHPYLKDLAPSPAVVKPVASAPIPESPQNQPPVLSNKQKIRKWLSENSVVYELIKWAFKLGDYKGMVGGNIVFDVQGKKLFLRPEYLAETDQNFSKEHELGLKVLLQDIKAMSAMTQKAGTKLVLFFIPLREQVYYGPAVRDFLLARNPKGPDPESYVFHTQSEIAKFTKEIHVPFFDLTPELQKHRDEAPLYFNYDRHLTPAGHAVVANAVMADLKPLGKTD